MLKWTLQGISLVIASMVAVKIMIYWDLYIGDPMPTGLFSFLFDGIFPFIGKLIDEKLGTGIFVHIFLWIIGALSYMPAFFTMFSIPRIMLIDLPYKTAIILFFLIDGLILAVEYFNVLDSVEIIYGLSLPYNYPPVLKSYFWTSFVLALLDGCLEGKPQGFNIFKNITRRFRRNKELGYHYHYKKFKL